MATPILTKVPPPPRLAVNDPEFNKWLIDLTNFINSSGGGIDPSLIPGYDALVATVNQHTTQINSLTVNVAANTSHIATLTTQISTLQSQILVLTARPKVLNGTAAPGVGVGSNGDWFADTNNLHIYVKTGGAWVLIV